MPFSKTIHHTEDYWTNHYEKFLKPVIESNVGIEVERSKALRTDIIRDIVKNLIYSQIVLADVTDLNANVLWELGVRQSFTNGTVVIAEKGTKIPSNIFSKPVIPYPKFGSNLKYDRDLAKFQDYLISALSDCKTYPKKSDSHVLETITGRGSIFEIINRDMTIRKLEALLSEFDYNESILKDCFTFIDQNKERNGNKYLSSSQRLKIDSVNLLLTSRYLNEDLLFYNSLIFYASMMDAANSIINNWSFERTNSEKWLVEFIPINLSLISIAKKEIEVVLKKIREIV